MKLSIIIVNYNSLDLLSDCVASIARAGHSLQKEVVLVNNDERKISPEQVSSLRKLAEHLEVAELNNNPGFGTACNFGAALARGEYLLFLNPDTVLDQDCLRNLIAQLDETENVAAVSPLLLWPNGMRQQWQYGKEKSLRTIVLNKFKHFNREDAPNVADSPFEVDWAAGTALMLRREVFEEIKGFDQNYFMYFEDVDLCRRLRKKGYKILVSPYAKVYHQSGRSFTSERNKKRLYYKSQFYYLKKNFGLPQAILSRIAMFPYYLKNVLLQK